MAFNRFFVRRIEFPKLLWRLIGHAHVVPAVRRDLVARAGDSTDQLVLAVRHPPENKESRARLMPREQLEQDIGLLDDARLERLPVGPRDAGLEGRDLEVLFDVDGEMMGDHDEKKSNGRAQMHKRRADSLKRNRRVVCRASAAAIAATL